MFWKTKKEGPQLSGNANFHIEPTTRGNPNHHTCTLIINCFSNSSKKVQVPANYVWTRMKPEGGGPATPLSGVPGNIYNLTSQDLGCTIKVEITPQERSFTGVGVVTLGPISLDPNVKSTLEGILNAGGSKFPVNFYAEEGSVNTMRTNLEDGGTLALTAECLKLTKSEGANEQNIKFKYGIDVPEIELNMNDPTKLSLVFKGREEEYEQVKRFAGSNQHERIIKIRLKTASRNARELIILAVRCFATKNYLMNSRLLKSIDLLFSEQDKLFADIQGKGKLEKGDLILEIENSKKEMLRLTEENNKINEEKECLSREVKRFEQELTETIELYQKIVAEGKGNSSLHYESLPDNNRGNKMDWDLKMRLSNSEEEKRRLVERIKEMEAQIEGMKYFRSGGTEPFSSDGRNDDLLRLLNTSYQNALISPKEEVDELKQENQKLKSRIASLESNLANATSKGSIDMANEKRLQDTKKLNEVLLQEIDNYKERLRKMNKDLTDLKKSQDLMGSSSSMKSSEGGSTYLCFKNQIEKLNNELQAKVKRIEVLEYELNRHQPGGKGDLLAETSFSVNSSKGKNILNSGVKSLEGMLNESRKQNEELLKELEELRAEVIKMKNNMKEMEWQKDKDFNKYRALEREKDGLAEELNESREKMKKMLLENERLSKDSITIKKRAEILEKESDALRLKTGGSDSQLEDLKLKLEKSLKDKEFLEADNRKLRDKQKQFHLGNEDMLEKMRATEIKAQEAQHQGELLEIDLKNTKSKLESAQAEVDLLRKESEKSYSEVLDCRKEREQYRIDCERSRDELQRILRQLQQVESQSKKMESSLKEDLTRIFEENTKLKLELRTGAGISDGREHLSREVQDLRNRNAEIGEALKAIAAENMALKRDMERKGAQNDHSYLHVEKTTKDREQANSGKPDYGYRRGESATKEENRSEYSPWSQKSTKISSVNFNTSVDDRQPVDCKPIERVLQDVANNSAKSYKDTNNLSSLTKRTPVKIRESWMEETGRRMEGNVKMVEPNLRASNVDIGKELDDGRRSNFISPNNSFFDARNKEDDLIPWLKEQIKSDEKPRKNEDFVDRIIQNYSGIQNY